MGLDTLLLHCFTLTLRYVQAASLVERPIATKAALQTRATHVAACIHLISSQLIDLNQFP